MAPRRAVRTPLFTLLAVLVLGSVLVACSDDGGKGSSTSSGQAEITGVQWVLDTTALVRGAGDVTVTAQFTDGQMTGESGCNRYFTAYTAKPATGTMTLGPVGGTRIACTGKANDVEQAYLAALDNVQQYRATSDSLRLLDAGGKVLLRYTAVDAAKAIKGDWVVTSFYTGDALQSPVVGSTLTAKFEGKQVSGESGCNSFSGEYTVDGDAIAIGPLASTLRACADPAVDEQEAEYLQALALAKTFTVTGDRLDLFREDGGFAVSFQAK
jgi:heat shock protein HslJ